jgi:hypothetical protein
MPLDEERVNEPKDAQILSIGRRKWAVRIVLMVAGDGIRPHNILFRRANAARAITGRAIAARFRPYRGDRERRC